MPTRLRFLLLQARVPGDEMGPQEHQCFAEKLGVSLHQIECWSLLRGAPPEALVHSVHAILVGGSGEFSVLGPEPWLGSYFDFMEDVVVDRGVPTFASCFGFQALVLAGGGEVVTDEGRAEVGTFTIELTGAGRVDPLFKELPSAFPAQLGHKDHATRLPSDMTHLASSALAPYQAVRIGDLNVVGTQFHPELDRATNTARYQRYWDKYGKGDPADDPIMQSFADSHEASALMPRWVELELMPIVEAGGVPEPDGPHLSPAEWPGQHPIDATSR